MQNVKYIRLMKIAVLMFGMLLTSEVEAKTIPSDKLTLLGRGWSSDEYYSVPFGRVPARLVDLFGDNENARGQSRCSTGLCFHFSTNSRNIGANYTLWLNYYMVHQAVTGTRGIDLYIYDTGKQDWAYLATHKPTADRVQTVDFDLNLDGSYHDFLIYLPLYDSVNAFSLEVDDNAGVSVGNSRYLNPTKRVMVYGSSVTQGGCASRTGMLGSSILGRMLRCQTYNFGFSAGGRLDSGSARVFADIKNVDVYVIDAVANASPLTIQTNLCEFVRILHEANPKAAFVFVDGLSPNYAIFTPGNTGFTTANDRQHQMVNYLRLLYPDCRFEIVEESVFDSAEGEATVDTSHYTDLGFMLWARAVAPVVEKLFNCD